MMTRKEAFEILELKPGSNIYEIERRYTLLAKRYRNQSDEETLKKVEQITMAYDVLSGRYVPPAPVDPKMEKVIFGRKRKDWANTWAYGKVTFFVVLGTAIFLGWLIFTMVTNTPPDFSTAIFGDFVLLSDPMSGGETKLEQTIAEQNPDFKKPALAYNLLTQRKGPDPQMVMGAQMKLTLMVTGADKVDLLVLDKIQYDNLVKEGVFISLDSVYKRLEAAKPDLFKKYGVKPLKAKLSPDDLPDGETPAEHVYGLDLSQKQLLNSLQVAGRTQILAISIHSEHKEAAENVIFKLLTDVDKWYNPNQPEMKEEVPAATMPLLTPAASAKP